MSHFYGSIQGARGIAIKGGTKASGIEGHIRGWEIGARVYVSHDKETGTDTVRVYATNGSGAAGHDVLIAEFNAGTLKLCDTCANHDGIKCQYGHSNAITCDTSHRLGYGYEEKAVQ